MIKKNQIIEKKNDALHWVIKKFPDRYSYERELEANLHLQHCNLPIPKLLSYGEDQFGWNINYQYIAGHDSKLLFKNADNNNRMLLLESAASSLASIHKKSAVLTPPNLQKLRIKEFNLEQENYWQKLIGSQLLKWWNRITPSSMKDINKVGLLLFLQEQISALSKPRSLSILHCDFSFRNMRVGLDNKVIILDFGAALYGDPVYDLTKILWTDLDNLDYSFSMNFLKKWSQNSGIFVDKRVIALYGAIQCVAAISWVDKVGINSQTNEVFREKAIRNLDMFLLTL